MPQVASPFIPCPNCECLFLTPHDLKRHLTVCGLLDSEWKKSAYDDSMWAFAEKMPKLRTAVASNGGKVTMGGYDISLDKSGKYLRKKVSLLG